jgi:predicted site-specific integrase-resolvase
MIKIKEENIYYRIADYAKEKCVTYECVRKWIKQGKLKTTIISNTTFVVEPKTESKND